MDEIPVVRGNLRELLELRSKYAPCGRSFLGKNLEKQQARNLNKKQPLSYYMDESGVVTVYNVLTSTSSPPRNVDGAQHGSSPGSSSIFTRTSNNNKQAQARTSASDNSSSENNTIGEPTASTTTNAAGPRPLGDAGRKSRSGSQVQGVEHTSHDHTSPTASTTTSRKRERSSTSRKDPNSLFSKQVPTLEEFYTDLSRVAHLRTDGPTRSYSHCRLKLLEKKFELYRMLHYVDETTENKNNGVDFNHIVKVDNHIHHSAAMCSSHLFEFIRKKFIHNKNDVVSYTVKKKNSSTASKEENQDNNVECQTLQDFCDKLEVEESALNLDAFEMQADHRVMSRFDIFNSRFSPLGKSAFREVFLKTDNQMGGRYLAELTRELLNGLERREWCHTEWRLSIYGKSPDEWTKLSQWVLQRGNAGGEARPQTVAPSKSDTTAHPSATDAPRALSFNLPSDQRKPLLSEKNRWMIQFPRLFQLYRKLNIVKNFQQWLSNLFLPLFEATLFPEKHPDLAEFLTHVGAFDTVDDESQEDTVALQTAVAEDRRNRLVTEPGYWSFENANPPYAYYSYFIYANIRVLNLLREKLGLNQFHYRPHCGEAGDLLNLDVGFLLADTIAHGIRLHHSPVMQYVYYLAQIGISVSPQSNNALFLEYAKNPFFSFFKRGLNVTLSTDDPVMFHNTREPLLEEYAVARTYWRLSPIDVCEVARNSVRQSSFPLEKKLEWLGLSGLAPYLQKNRVAKLAEEICGRINNNEVTNVPNSRQHFRQTCLRTERESVLGDANETDVRYRLEQLGVMNIPQARDPMNELNALLAEESSMAAAQIVEEVDANIGATCCGVDEVVNQTIEKDAEKKKESEKLQNQKDSTTSSRTKTKDVGGAGVVVPAPGGSLVSAGGSSPSLLSGGLEQQQQQQTGASSSSLRKSLTNGSGIAGTAGITPVSPSGTTGSVFHQRGSLRLNDLGEIMVDSSGSAAPVENAVGARDAQEDKNLLPSRASESGGNKAAPRVVDIVSTPANSKGTTTPAGGLLPKNGPNSFSHSDSSGLLAFRNKGGLAPQDRHSSSRQLMRDSTMSMQSTTSNANVDDYAVSGQLENADVLERIFNISAGAGDMKAALTLVKLREREKSEPSPRFMRQEDNRYGLLRSNTSFDTGRELQSGSGLLQQPGQHDQSDPVAAPPAGGDVINSAGNNKITPSSSSPADAMQQKRLQQAGLLSGMGTNSPAGGAAPGGSSTPGFLHSSPFFNMRSAMTGSTLRMSDHFAEGKQNRSAGDHDDVLVVNTGSHQEQDDEESEQTFAVLQSAVDRASVFLQNKERSSSQNNSSSLFGSAIRNHLSQNGENENSMAHLFDSEEASDDSSTEENDDSAGAEGKNNNTKYSRNDILLQNENDPRKSLSTDSLKRARINIQDPNVTDAAVFAFAANATSMSMAAAAAREKSQRSREVSELRGITSSQGGGGAAASGVVHNKHQAQQGPPMKFFSEGEQVQPQLAFISLPAVESGFHQAPRATSTPPLPQPSLESLSDKINALEKDLQTFFLDTSQVKNTATSAPPRSPTTNTALNNSTGVKMLKMDKNFDQQQPKLQSTSAFITAGGFSTPRRLSGGQNLLKQDLANNNYTSSAGPTTTTPRQRTTPPPSEITSSPRNSKGQLVVAEQIKPTPQLLHSPNPGTSRTPSMLNSPTADKLPSKKPSPAQAARLDLFSRPYQFGTPGGVFDNNNLTGVLSTPRSLSCPATPPRGRTTPPPPEYNNFQRRSKEAAGAGADNDHTGRKLLLHSPRPPVKEISAQESRNLEPSVYPNLLQMNDEEGNKNSPRKNNSKGASATWNQYKAAEKALTPGAQLQQKTLDCGPRGEVAVAGAATIGKIVSNAFSSSNITTYAAEIGSRAAVAAPFAVLAAEERIQQLQVPNLLSNTTRMTKMEGEALQTLETRTTRQLLTEISQLSDDAQIPFQPSASAGEQYFFTDAGRNLQKEAEYSAEEQYLSQPNSPPGKNFGRDINYRESSKNLGDIQHAVRQLQEMSVQNPSSGSTASTYARSKLLSKMDVNSKRNNIMRIPSTIAETTANIINHDEMTNAAAGMKNQNHAVEEISRSGKNIKKDNSKNTSSSNILRNTSPTSPLQNPYVTSQLQNHQPELTTLYNKKPVNLLDNTWDHRLGMSTWGHTSSTKYDNQKISEILDTNSLPHSLQISNMFPQPDVMDTLNENSVQRLKAGCVTAANVRQGLQKNIAVHDRDVALKLAEIVNNNPPGPGSSSFPGTNNTEFLFDTETIANSSKRTLSPGTVASPPGGPGANTDLFSRNNFLDNNNSVEGLGLQLSGAASSSNGIIVMNSKNKKQPLIKDFSANRQNIVSPIQVPFPQAKINFADPTSAADYSAEQKRKFRRYMERSKIVSDIPSIVTNAESFGMTNGYDSRATPAHYNDVLFASKHNLQYATQRSLTPPPSLLASVVSPHTPVSPPIASSGVVYNNYPSTSTFLRTKQRSKSAEPAPSNASCGGTNGRSSRLQLFSTKDFLSSRYDTTNSGAVGRQNVNGLAVQSLTPRPQAGNVVTFAGSSNAGSLQAPPAGAGMLSMLGPVAPLTTPRGGVALYGNVNNYYAAQQPHANAYSTTPTGVPSPPSTSVVSRFPTAPGDNFNTTRSSSSYSPGTAISNQQNSPLYNTTPKNNFYNPNQPPSPTSTKLSVITTTLPPSRRESVANKLGSPQLTPRSLPPVIAGAVRTDGLVTDPPDLKFLATAAQYREANKEKNRALEAEKRMFAMDLMERRREEAAREKAKEEEETTNCVVM
ncbi:unnamed protein product [Amoebophrya sp. A120]|nr:unnamed protein product [Amoebophrya sp. A120]|eukprot:GSA120T00025055001.1